MKSGQDCCYERPQVNMNEQDVNMNEQDVNVNEQDVNMNEQDVNMNEQDVNVNGWPGGCCYSDGNLCLYYFWTFYHRCFFSERAAHSKSATIVVFFTDNALPNAGSAFMVCIFWRST